MISWGALSDFLEKGKRLDFNSTFFLVFGNEYLQLFAIELNTGGPNIKDLGQLFLHGIDSTGKSLIAIGGEYAPFTKDIKVHEGLPIDRVTLYQSGEFYQTFKFKQLKTGFKLSANTIKIDPNNGEVTDLIDRWGDNIIGLTNESLSKLGIEAIPYIIEAILKQLLS